MKRLSRNPTMIALMIITFTSANAHWSGTGDIYYNGGNVGIGTSTPVYKLDQNSWADFVFEESYELPSLTFVERHIKEKGHLPGIPSASEVQEKGVDLGEMNVKLLQKTEELTLYLIDHREQLLDPQAEIQSLNKEVDALKSNVSN